MSQQDYVSQYKEYIMPTYNPQKIVFERGHGCFLYDYDGNKYLDFIAGVAVNSLGYGHPKLVSQIEAQIHKLIHVSNLFIIKEQGILAKTLCDKFGRGKAFFCNSGAEAIEGAIKLARKYGKKTLGQNSYEIITMKKSFHGRTLAAITATGQEKYQKDLEPLPAGFFYAEFGNIASIRDLVSEKTCAILIEPVQGEGGINVATKEFWLSLAQLCEEKQILLILDEIQTGIGRTGTFFAHEHYGIKPDVICLAKGLGGGYPIGAIIAKDPVANCFQPGDHASTFGGNPLACGSASAVISIIEEEDIVGNVIKMESVICAATREYKQKFPFIKDIRGIGLMWGIELDSSIDCAGIVINALSKGLLINCIGGNIIRIAPPLIIGEQELLDGFSVLEQIFITLNNGKESDLLCMKT
ncbi:MAG: aspartate aminotransferase family protein [Candidatus Margulisiibacteriota bacterium]|nr:MAG: acetylornithine aminotransferase [Candidatus Margulisbacteria bacterium GWD2_39_127]OGI05493.1 MAG: acetylornithine aminotransferase [Candidatus Margulisbacteria bacterium GWF2_38_17]OGI08309.1 MAG: acetylornithine aminotransferase [Candidatus Margulisbacteria bacterium GWE2_39_32]PZM82305.1 MAG: aspartate aminotransferase family protein [Candidatus Margulisiibacteriota bacterium]HAR62949.1 aspartate aminotransferase family protein [Candidatus Margulisiibacteriota bacterium]